MFKWFKLFGLVMKDKYNFIKNGRYKRLFGVHMYVGEVGSGKTISAVNEALKLKEQDERIKIYSNFYLKNEDGRIEHWSDMLDVPSYSIIILDEVQNTFSQREWNTFPPQLVQLLTQNRKWGRKKDENGEVRPPGIRLIMTTQDYENTDIMIRRLCNRVISCNSWFSGRLIMNRWYSRKEYEKTDEKRRNDGLKALVVDDNLRNQYDTYRILASMKNEEELKKKSKK